MNPKTNKQAWLDCFTDLRERRDSCQLYHDDWNAFHLAMFIVKAHMPRSNDRTVTKAKKSDVPKKKGK